MTVGLSAKSVTSTGYTAA